MSENPNAFRRIDPDIGNVLHYWDMSDAYPPNLTVGQYMTVCGRIATVEYVSDEYPNICDAFGSVQRYGGGPSLCCVWEQSGMIRCAFGEQDGWEWNIVDTWESGIQPKDKHS